NADLVRRENCESDRRGLYAVLTEHGMETMQKVAPHHVASVRRHFIDLLAPESLTDRDKALKPIAEHLRGQRGRPRPGPSAPAAPARRRTAPRGRATHLRRAAGGARTGLRPPVPRRP